MKTLGGLNLNIDEDATYTLPALTVTEQDVLIVDGSIGPTFLTTINLDLSALLLNATIRVYYKVDGANYRRRMGTNTPFAGSIAWSTSDGPWVSIGVNAVIDHDLKVTIQSSALGEVLSRDIPYSYNGAR